MGCMEVILGMCLFCSNGGYPRYVSILFYGVYGGFPRYVVFCSNGMYEYHRYVLLLESMDILGVCIHSSLFYH